MTGERHNDDAPTYPQSLLTNLARRMIGSQMPPWSAVVNVGSGAGGFTRQLRNVIPFNVPVVGIEPDEALREQAILSSSSGISFRPGVAELLPLPPSFARAVVAATAARQFNRPRFYASAAQALAPDGVIAVVESAPDVDGSPAARAATDFWSRYEVAPPADYPDYARELRSFGRFRSIETVGDRLVLNLTVEDFIAWTLSSSRAGPALASLGRASAEAEVRSLAERLADAGGRVSLGYFFQAFVAK
jgi:SAM-dependent methyltransferase